MMEFRRNQAVRPRARLLRGADGRLRPADVDGGNIGDIWAEQKRIRLAEAIERDRKKADKKKQRIQPKEVVVKIGLPKLKLPRVPRVKLPKVSKKLMFLAGGAVVVLALGITAYSLLGGHKEAKPAAGGVLNAQNQQPDYRTVLPAGKSIEDLGGWARVSPPDKAPVFAYVDTIGGVQINVSEQPLPEAFKKDTDSEVNKLAEQFGASQKFVVDGTTVHKGTSAKGPQSVIFAKDGLLLLVRASTELTEEQWAAYISALQ